MMVDAVSWDAAAEKGEPGDLLKEATRIAYPQIVPVAIREGDGIWDNTRGLADLRHPAECGMVMLGLESPLRFDVPQPVAIVKGEIAVMMA
jgi:hypothetical protein